MGTLTVRDLVFEGKLSVSEEWLDYFDILYPEQKTYINEWWYYELENVYGERTDRVDGL